MLKSSRVICFASSVILLFTSAGGNNLLTLTGDVPTMKQNQKVLEDSYCPSGEKKCDGDPGTQVTISTIGALIFVFIVGVCVGTDVTLDSFRLVFGSAKRAFCVGIGCQFGVMPLYSFVYSLVFKEDLTADAWYSYEAAVMGASIAGCLPGGNTSNLFTWFCGGNVPLSILMSLVSNICALFMMPLLLKLYYEERFSGLAVPDVPYTDLLMPLVLTNIGVATGMLVRAKGSTGVIWWTAKGASIFALVFLFLAVVMGLRENTGIVTNSSYSLWLFALTLQPLGYVVGFGIARLCQCSLRNAMTIAFETGVQGFALGLVMAQVGFNLEVEACQFDARCMSLLNGNDIDKYEWATASDGRLPEGGGFKSITVAGFLPGEAGARTTGGCCRFNELIFYDVYKFSAICALLYPLHALWQIIFLRKIFPGGFARIQQEYVEEECIDYNRKIVSLPTETLEPVYSKSVGSVATQEAAPATTILEHLDAAEARIGKEWALGVEAPVPDCPKDNKMQGTISAPWKSWKRWTWTEYRNDVYAAAASFVNLGLEVNASVAIYGFNCPQWHISAMGAIAAGAKCAGVYPTDTPEQVHYKVKQSGANVAVVEDAKKLQPIADGIDSLPKLKAIVMFGGEDSMSPLSSTCRCHAWASFMKMGGDSVAEVTSRRGKISPGQASCLVYTSGTTGMPKAVMLSHDNLTFSGQGMVRTLRNRVGTEYDQERVLSYLPLSHVAGFVSDISMPIVASALLQGFFTIYYARPYDLKEGTMKNRLTFVRPTMFLGVPRVWEKFQEGLVAAGRKTAELKGCKGQMPIFCCVRKTTAARWAKAQGAASARNMQYGKSGRTSACLAGADGLVLSNIRAALGLDCLKYAATGAAPMATETLEYFGSLGINICEIYGMSESSAYTTLSAPDRFIWGSSGFAAPGMQVKVFKVDAADMNKKTECPKAKDITSPTDTEQGEICFRGRSVMMGYMANPDLGADHIEEVRKKNAEALDADGWMHSGDMGCLGENGHVRITGRYKELIITAGGENIAPVPIEDNIKACCAALANVMMIGDKRKYNTVLLTLKASEEGELTREAQLVSGVTTVASAMKDAAYRALVENAIKATNSNSVVCPSNATKVQKFEILPADFTVEGDELTPTLKLKRKVIEAKYASVIEEMYSGTA